MTKIENKFSFKVDRGCDLEHSFIFTDTLDEIFVEIRRFIEEETRVYNSNCTINLERAPYQSFKDVDWVYDVYKKTYEADFGRIGLGVIVFFVE